MTTLDSTSVHAPLLDALSVSDRRALEEHLADRVCRWADRANVRVVYDILGTCNLRCKGCSVAPTFRKESTPIPRERLSPSTDAVRSNLAVLARFGYERGLSTSIIFGGGEPFLREDLPEIIHEATRLFGAERVGVDTNGTVEGQERIVGLLPPDIGYLGVSLDGLPGWHDEWRGRTGAFRRSIELIRRILDTHDSRPGVEVTSIALRGNLAQLPELLDLVAAEGVTRFSVHRAMGVGRMAAHRDAIPSAREYLMLFVEMIRRANEIGVDFHFHHSIEEIYAALLLGYERPAAREFGDPSTMASIGMTPEGRVVFDPWTMRAPWDAVSPGSLRESDLEALLAVRDQPQESRCQGCAIRCAGGSRVAAAVNLLPPRRRPTPGDVRAALAVGTDPACPLSDGG